MMLDKKNYNPDLMKGFLGSFELCQNVRKHRNSSWRDVGGMVWNKMLIVWIMSTKIWEILMIVKLICRGWRKHIL
ncbi:unnamed protein product [Meloidogyne enterolobii]|uniref:Uncharacterized protein n=1 Tax=Meloidogyne enterolobii TaxID=390850 RepID=A0ACB0ZF62_MELEN